MGFIVKNLFAPMISLKKTSASLRIRVMIVDDQESNLKIAGASLSAEKYDLSLHQSGKDALEKIVSYRPDIILLDLFMPEIDGVEVCLKIKSIPEFEEVPILFLTASKEGADLERAFEAGAVDYVRKPFDERELNLRIKTHMDLRLSKCELEERAQEMEQLNLEMKELIGMVSHDLKNPLANVISGLELITPELVQEPRAFEEITNMLEVSTSKMTKLIHSLLDAYTLENNVFVPKFEQVDIHDFVDEIVSSHRLDAARKNQSIFFEKSKDKIFVETDTQLLQQILDNLLSNAVKFTPKGERIEVRLDIHRAILGITVTNYGVGLTSRDLEQVFSKFAKLSTRPTGFEDSTGLGLSIVKSLVEILNGKISCRSEEGKSTTFSLVFRKPKLN